MTVSAVNDVTVANVAAINGVVEASIAAVNGETWGGGPPATGSLLSLDFDGADGSTSGSGYADDSPYARTFANSASGPEIDTAEFVDGGSSLLLTNSSHVGAACGAELSFAGDFLWQMDVYPTGGAGDRFFFCGPNNSPFLTINGTGNFRIGRANVAYDLASGDGAVSDGSWQRLVARRVSGTLTLEVDGAVVATGSIAHTYTFDGEVWVGGYSGSFYLAGWVDNVRMD